MITFLKIKTRPLFGPVYFTQISCYYSKNSVYCHHAISCAVYGILLINDTDKTIDNAS